MFSGKVFGALAGAAVVALAATGAVAQPKDKVKVGFIYVGPVGDHGWSYQHDVGRQAANTTSARAIQPRPAVIPGDQKRV